MVNTEFIIKKRTKLGERIKERRVALGMRQKDLADAIGTSQRNIYDIEAGRINFTIDKYIAICKALRIAF